MSGTTKPSPRVPGYELQDRIGSGGFSTVYRAYDPKFDRIVAIKLLNLAVSDPAAQRRFLRECRLMGRLGSHPHVLTVFAADVLDDDRPYIVMEYLEGGTIAEQAPLPQHEVLRIGVLVGSALAVVHAAGVIHRDVKPQNILLSGYGQPVLGDFGVSGVIEQGGEISNPMALSPLYAPPEAFHGLPDARSDQYSLAASLYALLAGRSPAEGDTVEALPRIMIRVLEDEPAALGSEVAHPRLRAALERGLAKDPAHRFPHVSDLVVELQAVQRELGGPVTAALGAGSAPSLAPPLGGEARVPTREPLGDDAPPPDAPDRRRPGPRPPGPLDGEGTRPSPWPRPLGDPDPADPPVPPPGPDGADDTLGTYVVGPPLHPEGGGVPLPPGAPGRSAGTRDVPDGVDMARTSPSGPIDAAGDERRNGLLVPLLAFLVVGIVLALVVVVVLQTGPGETTTTTTSPAVVFPDEVTLTNPNGNEHDLVWSTVEPGVTYLVARYEDIDPGIPMDVVPVTGTQLSVQTEEGVGTCYQVRVDGRGDEAPRIDPDACDAGTSPDDVLDP